MILSIHEPCHQDWNAMTETAKGRFCSSCSKTVIDFTMMTDAQLINYFLEHKNDRTCGRLLTEQLDTALSAAADPVRKRFGYWKYIAASALLLFTKASLRAQVKNDRTPQEHMLPVSKKIDTVVFNAPKTLEEVKVTADPNVFRRVSIIGGAVSVWRTQAISRTDTLKAFATSITGAAKIFPNPTARGGSFSISLKLKAAGIYNIEIISAAGAVLTQKQIEVNSLKSVQEVATNSQWPAGIYFVRLTDEVGKVMTTCKLVLN